MRRRQDAAAEAGRRHHDGQQAQWPAFSDEQVRSGIEPYAAALASEARAASPSVRLLLYETPARRDGAPQNASAYPELSTYEGMQLRIDRTYERLATLLRGTVVPAGLEPAVAAALQAIAWRTASEERGGP